MISDTQRLLVVGGGGMLGHDVVRAAEALGYEVLTPGRVDLDLRDAAAMDKLRRMGPLWVNGVINCAAYTAVDRAQDEPMEAFAINAKGAGSLAAVCAENVWPFIHVSTDFVFDGKKPTPYTEDDPTNPLGVYGKTKRAGEELVMQMNPQAYIVRTSWLFGVDGRCFPRTMIDAWRAGKTLRVVADQVGTPTYTGDLAPLLLQLLNLRPAPGIYHTAGPDMMSWHQFAELILGVWQSVTDEPGEINVAPIATTDWPTPAARPAYSALSTAKLESLGLAPMRAMTEALTDYCRAYSAALG